jgi:hypothetical protein
LNTVIASNRTRNKNPLCEASYQEQMTMQANLAVFDGLQNTANQSMVSQMMVFNSPEDIVQIQQAADTYHKILNDAIRSARQLVKVKAEYEKAQTEWTAAKSNYESGNMAYREVYEAVRQERKIQAENAREAKQKGNSEPLETYRIEDNTIRDIAMQVFTKDHTLNAIIDQNIEADERQQRRPRSSPQRLRSRLVADYRDVFRQRRKDQRIRFAQRTRCGTV